MERTSGEPLTLRSMLTSTFYTLVEGGTLLLGATGCLLFTLGPLWRRAPSIAVVLLLGLGMSGLEGFVTGLGARALNLRVRQSLGRMFGFRQVFSFALALINALLVLLHVARSHAHTHTHKL